MPATVLINAYGLFWRADEVNWHGEARGPKFRLLGRIGAAVPRLRLADFRTQSGLYILYGNYGPYYVGLTQEARLGSRLAAHILRDQHVPEVILGHFLVGRPRSLRPGQPLGEPALLGQAIHHRRVRPVRVP